MKSLPSPAKPIMRGGGQALANQDGTMHSISPEFAVIINKNSGTALKLGEAGVRETLEKSSLQFAALSICEPSQIEGEINAAIKSQRPVLLGGGDGTIKHSASAFMKHSHSFGILPFGTMNLLAQDLGLPLSFPELLEKYSNGVTEKLIDVAFVNSELFLCMAALGAVPNVSSVREDMRSRSDIALYPRLALETWDQLDRSRFKRIWMTLDGKAKRRKTLSLVVSNNLIDPPEDWKMRDFRRQKLNEGILGIYSASPVSFWDRVRLMLKLQFGKWKDDAGIRSWTAQNLTVQTEADQELMALDGETCTIETPLKFSLKKHALKLIVPT